MAISPNSLYNLVNQAAVKIPRRPDPEQRVSALPAACCENQLEQGIRGRFWSELVLGEALFGVGNHGEATQHFLQAVALATSPKSLDSAARQLETFAEAGFRSDSAGSLAKLLRDGAGVGPRSIPVPPTSSDFRPALSGTTPYGLPVIIHLLRSPFRQAREGWGYQGYAQISRRAKLATTQQPSHRRPLLGRLYYASQRHRFHLIVSGDLTYMGTKGEFDEARRSLEEICTGLSIVKERVHFVPGNHDVNWNLSKEDHTKRLYNYIAFLGSFYGDTLFQKKLPRVKWPLSIVDTPPPSGEILSFSADDKAGLVVVGMNSCVFENEQHHYGFIGDNQLKLVKSLLKKAVPPREWVRIAVIHHAIFTRSPSFLTQGTTPRSGRTCLPSATPDTSRRFLERLGFDIVLHGHKHKPLMRETRVRDAQPLENEPRPLIVCGAGSVSGASHELEHSVPNQYQVIDVRRIPRHPETEFLRIDWRILPLDAGAEWRSEKIWTILG